MGMIEFNIVGGNGISKNGKRSGYSPEWSGTTARVNSALLQTTTALLQKLDFRCRYEIPQG
jgi:hypothetical protein